MSDIKIRRSHSMPHDKARLAAEKMAKRLQKEFDLDYEWDGDVLVFERVARAQVPVRLCIDDQCSRAREREQRKRDRDENTHGGTAVRPVSG